MTKRPMAKIAKIYGDRIVRLGHDGGDGTVIMHCGFCGSGALVARSDGAVECQSCMTCFTMQVQPQYPFSPQTMNGQPIDPPGMPGNPNDQQVQMGDFEQDESSLPDEDGGMPPVADADEDGVPDMDEDAPPADDKGDDGDKQFPPKKSFLTNKGAVLDEDRYVRHLAFATAANKSVMAAKLRHEAQLRNLTVVRPEEI